MKFFDDNENFSRKMIKFKNEVERIFHFHFGFFPMEDLPYAFKTNSAPIDIYTNKSKLTIEIELPGISKDNILLAVHISIDFIHILFPCYAVTCMYKYYTIIIEL